MGTWAIPNTKEDAEELKKLMQKPLYCTEENRIKFHNLVGNDSLCDKIDEIEDYYKDKYDLRHLIKSYIYNLLIDYKTYPKKYYVEFEAEAIECLKSIVELD